MFLIVAIFAIFNTSCVTVRTGRDVTLEDISKMPPFDATVESIDIYHPFWVGTSVYIYLRKADGGYRLYLQIPSANKFTVNFVQTLHVGQRYTFPKIFADYYINTQTNNTIK
jgi:hypothetical protein